MQNKEKPSSKKITDLDLQAKELGIGGNFSPETMRDSTKKECKKEKIFNQRG